MYTLDSIKEFLGGDWQAVQDGISSYLSTDIDLLRHINAGILAHSGKQIRPVLSLLTARACNGGRAGEDSIRCAVAAELLHNATLLHDDVADEADVRRGEPTVRSLMGASTSVLIGDFWLVRAVRAVLDSEKNSKIISVFASTLSDLAEGEMLQLQKAETGDTVLKDYLDIIYRKTASLFVATTISAAHSVNAPENIGKAAEDFGKYLGLAFQMRDDIFDYMPSPDVGKAVGVDVMEKKITLPLLCALENVSESRQKEIRGMVCDIDAAGRDEILKFVRENGGIEGAQEVLDDYCSKAMAALDSFRDSEEKNMLESLVSIVSRRTR